MHDVFNLPDYCEDTVDFKVSDYLKVRANWCKQMVENCNKSSDKVSCMKFLVKIQHCIANRNEALLHLCEVDDLSLNNRLRILVGSMKHMRERSKLSLDILNVAC